MKAKWLLSFISAVLFVLLPEICGAIPETINSQGRLTNRTTDEPVNGTVSIVFRFYNADTGGNLLWEETQSVQVTNGLYSVALGSVTPFNLPFDQQYFLELEVNNDGPMSPRYALASSPYTLNAKKVGGYEVSETPQANKLLPLDASARFPSSAIPPVSNADTVDSFHASSTPTAGYLLPLNASGLFPSSVIPSVSNTDMVDNIHASATRTPNYLFPLDSTGKFSIDAIPTGTTATTCALGNHTHTGVYASIIHTHSPSDIIGSINADTVDGFHASSSPTAGYLLPLDATGKFPSSVIPAVSNADMVDNFHASATPTAGYLLPLNASGMFPSSVIPSVSNADKVDGFDASATPTANYLLALDGTAKFPSGAIRQGPGSGLDADTVDGNHASAFASASHTHAHSLLTGLGNDDHPQYLLADGSRIMSGGLTTQYIYLPGQYAAVPAGGVGVTIWTALNDNTFYTKLGAASTQHIFNRTVSASSTADNGVRGETTSADYSGVYGVNTCTSSSYPQLPAGVYGVCDNVNGTGVRGYSASGWGGTFNNNTSGRYTVVIRNNTGASSPGLYVDGYITKTGSVNFVVPHPTDPAKEIVYACLEGPEAGTYCRGEGTLVNGVAVLDLPEHFSLVTNEKGITVQVTPTAECNGVFVAKYDNKQITVKELGGGKSNATFHWLVNGIRKGYENYQVIREKGQHRLPEVAPASKEKPDEKEK